MAKNKNKIIGAFVALALLAGAWFFGGNYNETSSANSPALAQSNETSAPASDIGSSEVSETEAADYESLLTPAETDPPASTENTPTGTPNTSSGETPTVAADRYQSVSVPEGGPAPVDPQNVTVGDGEFTVILSVRCDTILNNMNLLNREKHELVPADGLIFPETVVTAYEGESVFDVLRREMRRARTHMEFRNTPIYNSAYIIGINNLYEFDTGELSGWLYKVNGWFPNYGCSRYQLQADDVIELVYTCDLGHDLGEYWLDGGQRDD